MFRFIGLDELDILTSQNNNLDSLKEILIKLVNPENLEIHR